MISSEFKLRYWSWRGLFALALVAYTLIFGEWFTRLLAPQPIMPRYITGTPWGVRGNIPNAHYWHDTPDDRVEFNINAQGMRSDRNFDFVKPSGVCRIELFGDSFFMGYELSLENSFAGRLERKLRDNQFNVEVLNLAVSGFGTAEMLQTYENYGRRFGPDLVIYSWHSSDFGDNVRADLYGIRDGALVRHHDRYLPSVELQDRLMHWAIYRWLSDKSHLYSLLRERIGVAAKQAEHMIDRMRGRSVVADENEPSARKATAGMNDIGFLTDPYATQLAALLLQRSQTSIENDGAGFAVVDIPFKLTAQDFRSTAALFPPELWHAIKLISPLQQFLNHRRPDRKLYYEHGEGHLTPLGADIMAEVTFNAIEEDEHLQHCRNRQESRGAYVNKSLIQQ